ncbi:MAG: type II secretion system F family protein [Actinomycetota bacterium]|nr:type II secretion system F family protein [Actinomycetota bacterium]
MIAVLIILYSVMCGCLWAAVNMGSRLKPSSSSGTGRTMMLKTINKLAAGLGRFWFGRLSAERRRRLKGKLNKINKIEVQSFLGYKILTSILLMLVLLLSVRGLMAKIGLGAAGLFGGYLLPDAILGHEIKVRNRDIVLDLPYILDLLYISTLSGQNIYRSMQIMVKNYEGKICGEFRQFIQNINLGRGKNEAYRQLIDAPNPSQFKDTLMLLNTAESCGSNISEILRQKSEQLKFEISQEAERKSRKASLLMLFPLALLILPSFVIMVGGPLLFSFGSDFVNF